MARLKVTKLCPCLSYFPGFFDNFESMAFFGKWGGGGGGGCFSQFFKGTTIKEPFLKLVQQKSMFLWKNCAYLDSVFSGDKDEYIDVWTIKV